MMKIDFSILKNGKYGVVQTDFFTGIILTKSGHRSLGESIKDSLIVANTLKEARGIAKEIVNNNPEIECSIRGHDGEHIEFVHNKDAIDDVPSDTSQRKWWDKIISKLF